jgi:hypothetical protein
MNEIVVIQAGLFDFIGKFFSQQALDAIGALILVAVAIFTKMYIVPLLKSQEARETAEHILVIADDVTDYFAQKFPNAHWSIWLDRAVDKIIEITGVGRETANRAARAALQRKTTQSASLPRPTDNKIEARS